jgi:hypothetical protein
MLAARPIITVTFFFIPIRITRFRKIATTVAS